MENKKASPTRHMRSLLLTNVKRNWMLQCAFVHSDRDVCNIEYPGDLYLLIPEYPEIYFLRNYVNTFTVTLLN